MHAGSWAACSYFEDYVSFRGCNQCLSIGSNDTNYSCNDSKLLLGTIKHRWCWTQNTFFQWTFLRGTWQSSFTPVTWNTGPQSRSRLNWWNLRPMTAERSVTDERYESAHTHVCTLGWINSNWETLGISQTKYHSYTQGGVRSIWLVFNHF